MFCFFWALLACLIGLVTSSDLQAREASESLAPIDKYGNLITHFHRHATEQASESVAIRKHDHSHPSTRKIEVHKGGELHSHAEAKQQHHALMRRDGADSMPAAIGKEAQSAQMKAHDLLEDEGAHEEAESEHVDTSQRKPDYVRKPWCMDNYEDDLNCNKKTTVTTTTTTVVNCVWAEWNEWNECTKSCGEGDRYRVRNPAVRSSAGGRECNGKGRQTDVCNVDPCATTATVAAGEDEKDVEKKEEAVAEEKKGGSSLYIIIGSVVGLGLLGVAAYFLMGDSLLAKKSNQGLAGSSYDIGEGLEEDEEDFVDDGTGY